MFFLKTTSVQDYLKTKNYVTMTILADATYSAEPLYHVRSVIALYKANKAVASVPVKTPHK